MTYTVALLAVNKATHDDVTARIDALNAKLNNQYASMFHDHEGDPKGMIDLTHIGLVVDPDAEMHPGALVSLLSIIHRDGGHYIQTHGIEKAVEDAGKIITNMFAVMEDNGVAVPSPEMGDGWAEAFPQMVEMSEAEAELYGSEGDDIGELADQDD